MESEIQIVKLSHTHKQQQQHKWKTNCKNDGKNNNQTDMSI
jgi:hypothetical protein